MDCRSPICRMSRRVRDAFTLVEVMISIAIALVLIVGISQIFAIAQRTTGGGAAMLAAIEGSRAIQSTLVNDMRTMLNDSSSPGLVIVSDSVAAFRNQQDKLQSVNPQDPRVFRDPLSGRPMSTTSTIALPTMVNSRIHRLDRLCFFARDLYHRQTGEYPSYTAGTSSNEAFIWLGHLALPNNTQYDPTQPSGSASLFFNPGTPAVSPPTDDNNEFAANWILGREVILMLPQPPTGPPPTGYVVSSGNPLSLIKPYGASSDGFPLFASRYDVAWIDINAYRLAITGLGSNWWQPLSGVSVNGSTIDSSIEQRYFANPFPIKPQTQDSTAIGKWMTAAVAQTNPVFVRNCTQFIVEFAGRFVTQDEDPGSPTYGNATGVVGGGAQLPGLDFELVTDPVTKTVTRQTRWYGFPRDSQNVLDVNGKPIYDVVPLSTFLAQSNVTFTASDVSIERAQVPFPSPDSVQFNQATSGQNPYTSPAYVCAWGPDTDTAGFPHPKMIRITLAIDDPNGRLNTEQTYQFVFTLP